MRFSKTAEYAIRVMSYLARFEGVHSAASLHQKLNFPYKYLTHLLTQLEKASLVMATRGRDGGFCLASSPENICLGDILDAIGEPIDQQRCILGFEACNAANPCALHDTWIEPRSMIDVMLSHTTLADLSSKQGKL